MYNHLFCLIVHSHDYKVVSEVTASGHHFLSLAVLASERKPASVENLVAMGGLAHLSKRARITKQYNRATNISRLSNCSPSNQLIAKCLVA